MKQPIGIFDSGVGGLSVWREIRKILPQESTLYFADQAYMPYGARSAGDVLKRAQRISEFLLKQHCKAVVVACNTASAVALKQLRDDYPKVPILGMEPAVKPAAALSRNGVVGVMATAATFQGRLFQSTVERHARAVQLVNVVCHGLAEQVEAGKLDTTDTEELLRKLLVPMQAAGADTVVLACTHYPFVLQQIQAILGDAVKIIDPAPAVARYLRDLLQTAQQLAEDQHMPQHLFYTTGPAAGLRAALPRLVAVDGTVEHVDLV
jgi:glutamate racemase